MRQSKNKLKKILASNRPWYFGTVNTYLKRPVLMDFMICSFFALLHYLATTYFGYIFFSGEDALSDILNELISSSLSAGGFVLAALAIIASIKQSVKEIEKGEKPKDGKEYFYNSAGYHNIIKMYSVSCVIFLVLFLYFSFLRCVFHYFDPTLMLHMIFFGIGFLSLSFLRCIVLLWILIKI